MSHRTTILITTFVIMGLTCTNLARAETENGAGLISYVPKYNEEFELPGNAKGRRWHSKGTVTSTDPGSSLHLSTQDCFGTTITDAKGVITQNGFCDAVDPDGDVWWIWWAGTETGSNWGYLGGTGKFEGAEGGGTTTVQNRAPDGRTTISWEGTWILK